MTEEPKMRLFSLILTAWRAENDQPQVALRNIVVLLAGEADLNEEGKKEAQNLFPDTDGWRDQTAIWTEITQGMPIGPFGLTWEAKLLSAAQNEGAE